MNQLKLNPTSITKYKSIEPEYVRVAVVEMRIMIFILKVRWRSLTSLFEINDAKIQYVLPSMTGWIVMQQALVDIIICFVGFDSRLLGKESPSPKAP